MHDLSFNKQKVGKIKIYSKQMLEDEELLSLYKLLKTKIHGARSATNQGGSVVKGDIGSMKVVVKHYRRGGVLHFINKHYYLSTFTASRAKREFEFLELVKRKGVNAPTPIAYAIKGGFVYRNWLATKEIENTFDLCFLKENDFIKIEKYTKELARQIKILIKNKIFHVDLHPGNVIVDENENLYILDFDKARFFKGSYNELRDKYILRWRRAVIKHNLCDLLSECLCANLRDNFNNMENF
ncbi:MAG: lipopolysaccharide kinase InaA family protein [Bdellovibrionota bacterium]|nr:lipopolysaccharide kinase InaA family protein [Pseudomonadota bacterium]MDY6089680.1 lipopolysaccharide kinase InaA family protein [Bdellovibrionota bacterium]